MTPGVAAAAEPLTSDLAWVCTIDDVPLGEGRAVTVGSRRIAVFNTPTGWFALDDACPHRGGPLSDGLVADRCVTCPLHERRFELETGVALSSGDHAVSHRIVVRGGDVLVELFPGT
jgi:nitrite reductase [NAD(P)H] small subunit